jgi:multiple sugar transport system permease protein
MTRALPILFILAAWGAFLLSGPESARAENPPAPTADAVKTLIRVTGYTHWAWSPPTRARRAALEYFMNDLRDPQTGKPWGDIIQLEPDNPLSFPGFSLKILNFAAGTGEEVIATQDVSQFYQYRDQNFFLPLNPFIWKIRTDAKGQPQRKPDGSWDYVPGSDEGRELLWPSWRAIPEVYKQMIVRNGDVYGLPTNNNASGLLFRRDVFQAAGLDPDHAPADWDEFFRMALQISANRKAGMKVYGVELNDALAECYLMGLGGSLARKDVFPTGKVRWLSTVSSPEMIRTIQFLRRLTLTKWIVGPDGRPFIVWYPDSDQGPSVNSTVQHPLLGIGKWLGNPEEPTSRLAFAGQTYGPSDIQTGVAYNQIGGQMVGASEDWYDLFSRDPGQIGMAINSPERYGEFVANGEPDNYGFAPVPAPSEMVAQCQIVGLNYRLSQDPAKARLAWAVAGFLAGDQYKERLVLSYVRESEGIPETLPPALLERTGFSTIADRIPQGFRKYWDTLDARLRPAIPAKNFVAITTQYLAPIYREATADPDYDYRSALAAAQEQIQARLDFAAGDYTRVKHRGLIIAAMVLIVLAVLVAAFLAFRGLLARSVQDLHVMAEDSRKGFQPVPWVMLAPALLLISLFSYYPIFKALPIAFQDYSVTGGDVWVGSANFVEVFNDPATWTSLLKTLYYMMLSIGIGFLAPVVLAILMSEIRAFNYFFRTVYYLPAVVAGIIMLLLWRRFFEASPEGLVNQVYLAVAGVWDRLVPSSWQVAPVPVDWLHHPYWGIPCVVFVGIWGGMGPGMLIYLAALKSIPDDLYEAAEIDGASWWERFRHITLSYLRPLLVINLIGAVISAFQSSGNILALSGNFPATYTFAVHLWFETFGLGNFGVGTALSWIMAAILMGFTVGQLRILRKVEFRRAEVD